MEYRSDVKHASAKAVATAEYPMKVPLERCGARTRVGNACRRVAGWGTPHLGEGRCALHGGLSTTHGALSVRTTDPATQTVADRLELILKAEPQAILRPADRQALESSAVLVRQREKLEAWLEKNGVTDETGKVRPAVEALVKVSRALLEHLRELGMTPSARARLGLDVAKGFDLAAALAEANASGRYDAE